MMLFFWSGKHALLASSNAFVCVQAFKQKFRRGNYKFGLVLRFHVNRVQLLRETLYVFQSIEQFGGASGIGKFQLASQIEPLRDLLHVAIFEIRVKRFSNGESNQVANHRVCSPQFTFILEFEFAGEDRKSVV